MSERKDTVFNSPRPASDFRFGEEVASVFDDMVDRSVPFYGEIQRMITEMGKDYAVRGTNVYDLGCSTGTMLILLDKAVDPDVRFIGIDDSSEMLDKCREKLEEAGLTRRYELQVADLNSKLTLTNASVVNLCLTLQFIRPLNRARLVKEIYDGLNPNGCLLLTEKVLGEESLFNRQFIDYYYQMKRRHHYSDMEIAQKREALENVLIPYKLAENLQLLRESGFKLIDIFFKWYNFCGIIAVK
ncbi:MAG: carboxy-S-adenosyl-L-methionine synthase CmoA [Candidatus Krumholzibacteriia bacterium]